MEKGKPVGIWIRVSTEDQAKGESPEHHEKRARYYAESKGWNIRKVYHLEAVSGKSVMGHPETQTMLEDIKTGHITGLIFSKLARLARNTKELLEFSEIFREYNSDLISLQESIDTSTPAGRLFYTMIAAMAQWEREEISERVAASVPIRAKLGKPTGGQASFGYQWVDKKLIPHPTEAPVRKLIYELFVEHQRKKTVARILNERGYRTRKGSKFSDTTIERLLRDPTAKGLFRANYTKSLGDNKKWVLKPEDQWVYSEVEPVVSEELWNTCNHILEDQLKKNKKPSRKATHLFTGFVFCGCNSKMYVPSNNPKYTCFKCKNKIGTKDLEEIFHHQLKNFFFSETEIAGYLNNADQVIKEKEELVKALLDEKRKVEKEMEKIYKSYIEDEIDSKDFGSLYRPKSERVKQIDDQIPELQGEIDFLKIQYLSSDQILNEAKDLYSRWPELTDTEKRRIIENITDTIVIGIDDIAINLCYLPQTPSSASMSSELVASGQRNFIPALPFCKISIDAKKPNNSAYPETIQTLGDHLRKRRLDLGLLQSHVANLLSVSEATVCNWENNLAEPSLPHLPKIYQFLGYVPGKKQTTTLGEKIIEYRKQRGLSQEQLARELEIDPGTLLEVEKERREPTRKVREKIKRFIDD